ncbi:type IV secretory system conjugative DNA transfer family protein [Thermoflavimicrobium daqui]|uniref:Type IV secretion system protein VirD4 n=1 Tax=Thermoflavimicrobium daqui TaxID=2137476 RepID=A0A364K2F5_9BACL|nr:type IV secretion system DNA-binding domain-containing protein [Thermoflavimicrobium daqui]RAL22605.1 type IV secretion system protein VirD4 [Thermoflavimicrobium daqui]
MKYIHSSIMEGQELKPLDPGTVVGKGKGRSNGNVGILGLNQTGITLHPNVLARHILTLGAIGSGKTVTMNHIVKAIRQTMNQNDVMIFFDAKGDYLEEFYQPGDYVISNHIQEPKGMAYWNIYKDILMTPKIKREETIREIATAFFKEDIEHSQAPIFAMGARDIFAGILTIHAREMESGTKKWNNFELIQFIQWSNDVVLRNMFLEHPDLKWIRNYIQKDGKSTTQSFIVHLYQTIFKLFSGNFARKGDFSIREVVTKKEGRAVFLEFDLANGNILEPIYTVLLDLAMKEVLGRSASEGNVYFILDEFPLIPKLNYMDNALNFGRSLGVKIVAGIQNVGQVEHRYGRELGHSILSGFGSVFAFRLNDVSSRDFVTARHGATKRFIGLKSSNAQKGIQDLLIDGKVIEDWNIVTLKTGQCIVSLPDEDPFIFFPVMYRR